MIRAILLDDEPQHSRMLQLKLLEMAEDVEIVGTFSDPEEALGILPTLRPDVLFLDVEMPRLSGFQLLQQIGESDFEVVFVTAFSDYAVRAIRFSALDFLTKPVDREELASALTRLREKLARKTTPAARREQLDVLFDWAHAAPSPAREPRIALPIAQDIRFVPISDIVRVESDNNYSTFFLASRERIIVSRTLKDYERLLEPQGFFRTNRSNLVNLSCITRYKKTDGCVLLTDGSEVEVAASKREDLLRRMLL